MAIFAPSVPKVMICATDFSPYFLRTYSMTSGPAVVAKIDVDIGRRDTLGIQEALEKETILERIEIGDAEDIRNQATRRAATAGADGNIVALGVVDEIPDDKESSW